MSGRSFGGLPLDSPQRLVEAVDMLARYVQIAGNSRCTVGQYGGGGVTRGHVLAWALGCNWMSSLASCTGYGP